MMKLSLIIFIVVITVSGKAQSKQSNGCTIKLPTDIPKGEPIYLQGQPTGKLSIYTPANETNLLRAGASLSLSCATNGQQNLLSQLSKNFTQLKCKSGDKFEDDTGRTFRLRDLNCTRIPNAELKITGTRCATNRGYIYDVGFQVNPRNFASIFRICYCNITENTFYSVHTINGAAIKYSIKESQRREFKATGMVGTTKTISQVYTKKNQIERFQSLFGSNQRYLNNTMFLSRGHLAPDADFIFSYAQLATYFYANVAPQFQSINGGNWVRVENMGRELANDYGSDFLVYTGYYDILALAQSNGKLMPIYLDVTDKIEVPKWFFKAMKNVRTDAAIVMITLNNPFARIAEVEEFCTNVCERASLSSKFFTNIQRGYTFCCEVGDFKRVVSDLPGNFTAASLLNCAHAKRLFDT